MIPCWPLRASFGLFVCGCLIGGHVIDLEIAKLFAWIIGNKSECMTSYMVYFDGSWSEILTILSWIGIGLVIFLYTLYLISILSNDEKGYFYYLAIGIGIYVFVFVANCLTAVWIVGAYANNYWLNEQCSDAADMSYAYGLLAGSYILPISGLCAFAWCFIAIS